jgi:hypothetical protein
MSFKSVMKKIGKVALKVAPIAAAFIPGVGIPLAMAISGAANAASTKASGGTWKQALLSGGIGAGTAAIGGTALKGIGPSSGALAKMGAGAAGKVGGTGVSGAIGASLGQMGKEAAMGALGGSSGPTVPTYGRGTESNTSSGPNTGTGTNSTGIGPTPGMAPGFAYGATNPNLSNALSYGARLGKMNQPFRSGYNVNYPGIPAFGNQPAIPSETRTMPPIFSPNLRPSAGMNGGGPRRKRPIPTDSGSSDQQPTKGSSGY